MQFVQFVLHYRLTPLVLTLFKEAEVSEGLSLEHRWLKPFLQLRKAVFVDAGAEGALATWCGDSLVDIYGVSEGAMVKDLLDKGESVNVWDLLGALILFQVGVHSESEERQRKLSNTHSDSCWTTIFDTVSQQNI